MEFGYFTLSDNHYENNTRDANTFVSNITDEALYADQIGMHSAWIGEHHFNLLGVNASPLAMLAQLAGATTKLALSDHKTLPSTGIVMLSYSVEGSVASGPGIRYVKPPKEPNRKKAGSTAKKTPAKKRSAAKRTTKRRR